MQKIKVVKVEIKTGVGKNKASTLVALFDDKGVRFSGFLPELQDIHEGDTVEAEIEVDGQYHNIKSLGQVTKGTTQDRAEAQNTSAARTDVERPSIEAQVAAKIGSDLLAANIIPLESPLGKMTVRWAISRLSAYVAEEAEAPPTLKQSAEADEFDKRFGKPGEKPPALAAKTAAPAKATPFANVGAFMTRAYAELHLTLTDVHTFPTVSKLIGEGKLDEAWPELVTQHAADKAARPKK